MDTEQRKLYNQQYYNTHKKRISEMLLKKLSVRYATEQSPIQIYKGIKPRHFVSGTEGKMINQNLNR